MCGAGEFRVPICRDTDASLPGNRAFAMTWTPHTETELLDMVASARADSRTIEIVGRGTKRGLGRAIETTEILDVSALSGIVRYEPDEFVITARAATPIAEIEGAIAERRQRMGFDPADWSGLFGSERNVATIGGTVSADACGSARIRHGAARDHLLGYRSVNGLGEAYKAGGKVVKNVTGFDMPKLVCGAMGTLGVLTEVTLRLVPRARWPAVLMVRNADTQTGFALLRRIWSSPLEATGLALVPKTALPAFPELGDAGNGAALIRLEGDAAVLEEKVQAADLLLRPHEVECPEVGDDIFTRIGAGAAFANRGSAVWRIFVPPAQAAPCADELAAQNWIGDWAGGAIWVEGGEPDSMQALAARFDGFAQLMRGDTELRRHCDMFLPRSPIHRAVMQRVKAAFDPSGLFNPGRMFDGI
jgi:glycolate oxidase FAD binding subunit